MNDFRRVFAMQTKHMLMRNKFKFAVTALLLVITAAFVEQCIMVNGADKNELYSAASGWIGVGGNQNYAIQLFFNFLIFPLAALAFSDSQYENHRQKICPCIFSRCSRKSYLWSGALLSFLGGFTICLAALALSQLLSFTLFPLAENRIDSFIVFDSTASLLFPFLHYNLPYLENVVFILYASLVAGLFALVSYSISQFIRRGALLIVAGPMVFTLLYNLIIETVTQSASYELPMNLFPNDFTIGHSLAYWLAIPLFLLIIGWLLVFLQSKRFGDELL